jgi:hypothetical protein
MLSASSLLIRKQKRIAVTIEDKKFIPYKSGIKVETKRMKRFIIN